MTNTTNALGAPDGNFAATSANGEYMTVSFGQTISNGTTVYINMALASGSGFNVTFFQSIDGSIFTNQTQIPLNSGTTPTDYTYTLNADADYIRVRADGGTERQLYHLYFITANPCSGGVAVSTIDTDSDGIDNHLDLDSDQDCIPDLLDTLTANDFEKGYYHPETNSFVRLDEYTRSLSEPKKRVYSTVLPLDPSK